MGYPGRVFVFTDRSNKKCAEKFQLTRQYLYQEGKMEAREIKVQGKPHLLKQMMDAIDASAQEGKSTELPQIFFNSEHLGGWEDLQKLPKDILLTKIHRIRRQKPGPVYDIYKAQHDIFVLKPEKLHFPPPHTKDQIETELILHNTTGKHAAFKMKTTQPKKYNVKPKHGYCPPNSEVKITISLESDEISNDERFRIEALSIPYYDEAFEGYVDKVFETSDPKKVIKQKVSCDFGKLPPYLMETTNDQGGRLITLRTSEKSAVESSKEEIQQATASEEPAQDISPDQKVIPPPQQEEPKVEEPKESPETISEEPKEDVEDKKEPEEQTTQETPKQEVQQQDPSSTPAEETNVVQEKESQQETGTEETTQEESTQEEENVQETSVPEETQEPAEEETTDQQTSPENSEVAEETKEPEETTSAAVVAETVETVEETEPEDKPLETTIPDSPTNEEPQKTEPKGEVAEEPAVVEETPKEESPLPSPPTKPLTSLDKSIVSVVDEVKEEMNQTKQEDLVDRQAYDDLNERYERLMEDFQENDRTAQEQIQHEKKVNSHLRDQVQELQKRLDQAKSQLQKSKPATSSEDSDDEDESDAQHTTDQAKYSLMTLVMVAILAFLIGNIL